MIVSICSHVPAAQTNSSLKGDENNTFVSFLKLNSVVYLFSAFAVSHRKRACCIVKHGDDMSASCTALSVVR